MTFLGVFIVNKIDMSKIVKLTEKDLSRLVKRVINEGLSEPITLDEIKQELSKSLAEKTLWDNRKVTVATATITLMDGKLYFGDPTKGALTKTISC